MKHTLTRKFSSKFSDVDNYCDQVKDFLINNSLEDYIFSVILLLREALNNAVIHGCNNDGNKIIRSSISLAKNIVIKVSDSGNGFNWKKKIREVYQDKAISGRGVIIFKLYAAEVKYNSKGNKLKITIIKGDSDGEL